MVYIPHLVCQVKYKSCDVKIANFFKFKHINFGTEFAYSFLDEGRKNNTKRDFSIGKGYT